MSLAFLVHLTTAMIVVPAAVLAYLAAVRRATGAGGDSTGRAPAAAFPATPGGLAASGGRARRQRVLVAAGTLAGLHQGRKRLRVRSFVGRRAPPSPPDRLVEAEVQAMLIATGLPGLVLLRGRAGSGAAALAGFCLAGFFWGYLAARSRPWISCSRAGRPTPSTRGWPWPEAPGWMHSSCGFEVAAPRSGSIAGRWRRPS